MFLDDFKTSTSLDAKKNHQIVMMVFKNHQQFNMVFKNHYTVLTHKKNIIKKCHKTPFF